MWLFWSFRSGGQKNNGGKRRFRFFIVPRILGWIGIFFGLFTRLFKSDRG